MANSNSLFSPFHLGNLDLKNRVVMAPMTRCRALNFIPQEISIAYYVQRAGAGLIVTEGTAPSAEGLGYARTPGIYNTEQIEAWSKITRGVHNAGGKIFLQIMHAGRIAHSLNKPEGARTVAPSAIQAKGEMYTDQAGMQPHPLPYALTENEIESTIQDFVNASKNAIIAGFDGVELHGANGYLIEQFINPGSNTRTDNWGGNVENRMRFPIEIARRVAAEIGAEKTSMRLSPYGPAGDLIANYPGIEEAYIYLAEQLSTIGLIYLHIVDHSAMGAPSVPDSIKVALRKSFKGVFAVTGGYNGESAQSDLDSDKADLIGFGRPFISNPDLVNRLEKHIPLAEYHMDTFYSAGVVGYTDYSSAKAEVSSIN